jgi:type IV pilus assembly protein PilB
MNKTEHIGEILVQKGLIDRDQLELAVTEFRRTRQPLGQILLRFGFIQDESVLLEAVAEQTQTVLLKFDDLQPKNDQRLKELVPKEMAIKHLILPLSREGYQLRLALSQPPDVILMDNLQKMTECEILPMLATEEDLLRAIERFYGTTELEEVVSSTELDEASSLYVQEVKEEDVNLEQTAMEADQAPVIKLVDLFLKRALDDRASDIHIEPYKDQVSIRYRIDGVLYALPPPPKQFYVALVSRVKIIAKLDIAEKRIPQDGSFSINYKGRQVDVRVSTVPLVHGEKVVMRLLDKNPQLLDLTSLGMEPEQLNLFEAAIQKPYGLVLITGPTGSGKSTTLYAALNRRLSPKVNILTIEDPVEYQVAGVNQVQVKPEIGLTFATGLRAFLRQDPDVILVGEVRDLETAEICIRAALTGHLVMSTLHTNDAPTAVTRLVDLGVKPFLVASSLLLIGAQRLVRCLCEKCKEPYPVDEKTRKQYPLKVETLYRTKGCKECRQIGYWGRKAIYEILPVDEPMRRAVARGADMESLRRLAKEGGYGSLLSNGLKKVEQGVTSLEEVLSVAYE